MSLVIRIFSSTLALALVVGCSTRDGIEPPPPIPDTDGGGIGGGCDPSLDADGDGIADAYEQDGDPDGDGIPNLEDDDSDGDGVPDADEARTTNACTPADSDQDGLPDFLDEDSDADGLTDREEAELGTNPQQADSDGDGAPDVVEVRGSGTDPLDATSTIDPNDFYVVLPFEGDAVERPLLFDTTIEKADVFFLFDMTGSMYQERTNLIQSLTSTIIPGLESVLVDMQMGLGGLDDYPVSPHGGGNDRPFYVLRDVAPVDEDRGAWSIEANAELCPRDARSRDLGMLEGAPNGVPDILEAASGLPCHYGADGPESYASALHAVATGDALHWATGSVPARVCPDVPDERGDRIGHACFRPGALPIVVLVGDNAFHEGPGGSHPYNGAVYAPPSFEGSVAELSRIGARVVSVHSSGTEVLGADFDAIAQATGAVREDGSPLSFPIAPDGSGLDARIVDAVTELVGGTPQDVSSRLENADDNLGGFDATRFVRAVTPVEGYRDGAAGTGYEDKDDQLFTGVLPGTAVEFRVRFENEIMPQADRSQVFRARIVIVGNGSADLDSRNVYILVPHDRSGPILI